LARTIEDVKDKEKRILDVAIENGFNSHETFTRAFKDAYGFTPTAYRENPVLLHSFNKPDLMLGYVMIDEGVPLISDGMVLEINRKILAEPLYFVGVKDYVRMSWHKPNGKVTGVDEPGATWAHFHKIEHKIKGEFNGCNLGMSYNGDAPEGYFTYFAGKKAQVKNSNDNFHSLHLPTGEYIVCGFEAETFKRWKPVLNSDNTLTLTFKCSHGYYARVKEGKYNSPPPNVEGYFERCAGGRLYELQKVLGIKLRIKSVDVSALLKDVSNPVVFTFEIVD